MNPKKSSHQSIPLRLLARMADHETPQDLGITLVHEAAFKGDYQKVKELIDSGVSINAIDRHGWTPLHDAVIQGHTHVVALLIAAGADINAQDNEERYTPLHEAARMNYPIIMQLLRAAGADETLKDRWNKTARDIEREPK